MTSPNVWGPRIWRFIHTLIEKLKFDSDASTLFRVLKQIVFNLPCPSCSRHANLFLMKNQREITNKEELKELFFMFHNFVNAKTGKSKFEYKNVRNYKDVNVELAFQDFVSVFHTNGNMGLIMESFQRKMALSNIRKWFIKNRKLLFD